ncbi:MAG TPA: pyridoxamine 5'-phosphate oxidase family protein [Candidatus Acidoferrales bacterium]|nr:pyridoxamine 5'-phosphate oxidase family protein [Candidatus Acidoferrales bacterium]
MPSFFESDARRTEYAWNDWDQVAAFIGDQAVCRIAVNDGTWPYVVAQTYHFVDGAFLLHFSRHGRLAAALERDPHCTIEIDQIVSLLKAPRANNTSAEYRSVVARCTAALSSRDDDIETQQYVALEKYRPEKDYLPIDRERATRRILAVRAAVVWLSAKKRILEEGGNPSNLAYARYPFPPSAALSHLPPEAFDKR